MEKQICFSQLKINTRQIIRGLGYTQSSPPDELPGIIDEILTQIKNICLPVFSYKVYKGILEKDILHIRNIEFHPGPIISQAFKECNRFPLFTTTAGTGFQQFSEKFHDPEQIVRQYIIDRIGSEIAENTANYMQKQLKKEWLTRGYTITNRYSPGYCGWNLQEQHLLFSLLEESNCGIRLTGSGLMYPIKSISGIIGIGKEIKKVPYGCRLCNYPDCFQRKNR